MEETLFRQKSLDKVKSPDNLSEYIKVVNPSVWVLLASVLVLLLGLCCWGIFGSVQTVIAAQVQCDNGESICVLSQEDGSRVTPGMTVSVNGTEATVREVRTQADGCICYLTLEQPLPDGLYDARIVVESLHPISFLLN